MTNLSACAGPSRHRRAALPILVAAVAATVAVRPAGADTSTVPAATPPVQSAPAFPAFLDDRRLRAIESHAKPRFEALALRRAEKLRRRAIEADLKRKAEEMRRTVDAAANAAPAADSPRDSLANLIAPSQAIAAPIAQPAARPAPATPIRAAAGVALPLLAAPTKPQTPADCRAGSVTSGPLPGGRITIDISEPCRKGELVTIRYTPYVFMRPLDAEGRLRFVLDLFQGADAEISVVYANGETRPIAIGATDLDQVSKVAVIWGKPVNLDLHVYEYAAASGHAGHVWPMAPSDAEAARADSVRTKRGRGFLSFASNGTQPGHQVEVYTVWHHKGQTGGIAATALDYETRSTQSAGATCGNGELAEIAFETVTLAPRRPAVRERGLIPRAPCGAKLIEKARYQDDAVADLSLSLD